MRRSLIIYGMLLPFLLASSLRIAAAMSDAGSSSPWNNPVATSCEMVDDEYGLNSDNLITIAPVFDSVPPYVMPRQELARGSFPSPDGDKPSSLVTLNRTFRI